jgi:hypothetical protein
LRRQDRPSSCGGQGRLFFLFCCLLNKPKTIILMLAHCNEEFTKRICSEDIIIAYSRPSRQSLFINAGDHSVRRTVSG